MKQNLLEYIQSNILLFDGGMGTEIYARGVFINQCYDELNLSRPQLIREIHRDFIEAGAKAIETNTFGANHYKLQPYGLEEKIYDINYQGVKIAKEVAGDNVYVIGSVGPLGKKLQKENREKFKKAYREQLMPIMEAGADAIIFETFFDLQELLLAVTVAKQLKNIPVIAQMTINDNLFTIYGIRVEEIISTLDRSDADIIGLNCSVGPKVMHEALEKINHLTKKPISILPNAGYPQQINGRKLYLTSSEYLAEYSRRFIQSGARVIGGCCGTTPEHIKTIKHAISSFQPKKEIIDLKIPEDKEEIKNKIDPATKSGLAAKLYSNEFICAVEMVPPRGINTEKSLTTARTLRSAGVHCINLPDGPRASSRMGAPFIAKEILDKAGIEPVLHYTARDRNLLGIISDFIGIHAIGIRNLLLITGDPPKMGDLPDATAVFDVDSIGLITIANNLNNGRDIGGNSIGEPTQYLIGAGVNPGALDIGLEMKRFERKIKAGAEYFITQPVFDLEILSRFLDHVRPYKIPVIAGVWPLVSLRNAEFMNNEVPGASVSADIMEKMKAAKSKEEAQETGIQIAQQTILDIKDQVQGVQISMPFGNVKFPLQVLEVLKK
ncbi:MAG: bifunctional homocysteine S-methyltransferase/methylenetetrahydrofolate reductase [Candidatus Marinimicrobia bacterium]|nr:bifunctional homocysteine S-methyltransferase/methylenetetrahydrofolate reductase [Candidatus Neomarinimicrobiota bacterium]